MGVFDRKGSLPPPKSKRMTFATPNEFMMDTRNETHITLHNFYQRPRSSFGSTNTNKKTKKEKSVEPKKLVRTYKSHLQFLKTIESDDV